MGIQVSSDFTERFAVAMVHSGVIGKVKEVHSFSEKDWGDLSPVPDSRDTPPDWLNWDHWLGMAQDRAFIDGYYHPGNWRKRRDFGTGTLGDIVEKLAGRPLPAPTLIIVGEVVRLRERLSWFGE